MMAEPKFVALLPVRDEGDIIRQCLQHTLLWADKVFIYDTGSVDNTVDIVEEFARNDTRVVNLGSEPVYYNENRVRGLLFNAARDYMNDGDWFLRLDADEFHHIHPPEFVRDHISGNEGTIYHQYYNFELTDIEAQGLVDVRAVQIEREKPIIDRRRHFTISRYAEPRMCRYRSSMRWPSAVSFPYNAGLVARARIPIRHYPHRDPPQLKRRYKLRAIMMADRENRENWSDPEAHHWSNENWSEFVFDSASPDLHFWEPDTPLVRVSQDNHVKSGVSRKVQQILYAIRAQYILDLSRPKWSNLAHPLPISEDTQQILRRELAL